MKTVVVKWFAAYREATGTAGESVTTTAATTAELFGEMTRRHAGLEAYRRALVAINDELVDWKTPFADGDQVLFFPPVAGG